MFVTPLYDGETSMHGSIAMGESFCDYGMMENCLNCQCYDFAFLTARSKIPRVFFLLMIFFIYLYFPQSICVWECIF